ncbi:MAG: hypothetical protein ACLRPT_02735 [Akkermansia muciniphila]
MFELKCVYHEYSLTACGPLNARAAEVCRKGALIKTDEGGYGCIQPWPELGDATLPEELDALRKGRPLPLGIRAAECARTDGEARAKGVSLFDGLHIPKATPRFLRQPCHHSHHGIQVQEKLRPALIWLPPERLTMLASMVPWRWRPDFNGCLNENDAQGLEIPAPPSENQDRLHRRPVPLLHPELGTSADAGMPLALTWARRGTPAAISDLPIIRIVKPAREAPEYLYEPPAFTTVMDHPVTALGRLPGRNIATFPRNFFAASARTFCLSRTPSLTRWAA